jgi:hypothetical protein
VELHTLDFLQQYDAMDAHVTPNKDRIYFSSQKEIEDTGSWGGYDIYYVEQNRSGWSYPKNTGSAVNSKWDEFHPVSSREGILLFVSTLTTQAVTRSFLKYKSLLIRIHQP